MLTDDSGSQHSVPSHGKPSDEAGVDLAILQAELEADDLAEAARTNTLAVDLQLDGAGAPQLQLQDPVGAEHEPVAGVQRPPLLQGRSIGDGHHPAAIL